MSAKGQWRKVMRRTSSLLSVGRSANASDSDKETSSAAKSSTPPPAPILPPVIVPPAPSKPSPIAESPVREAAATDFPPIPPVGPSPLSQSVAESQAQPPKDSPDSTVDYGRPTFVPPPLVDSQLAGLGPGAFTDEIDDLPQPTTIRDPSIRHPDSVDGHISNSHSQAPSNPQDGLTREGANGSYFDLPVAETPEPDHTSYSTHQTGQEPPFDRRSVKTADSASRSQLGTDQRDLSQTASEPAAATADSLIPEPSRDVINAPERGPSPQPLPPVVPEPVFVAAPVEAPIPPPTIITVPMPVPEPVFQAPPLAPAPEPVLMPVPAPSQAPVPQVIVPQPMPVPYQAPINVPPVLVPMPIPYDAHDMSDENVWVSQPSHPPSPKSDPDPLPVHDTARGPISEPPPSNVFSDPIVPRVPISMPGPSTPFPNPYESRQDPPAEIPTDISESEDNGLPAPLEPRQPPPPTHIILPLPPRDEVIAQPARRSRSLGSFASSRTNREMDETRPLLSRQGSRSFKQPSYMNGTPGTRPNQLAEVWPSQAPAQRLRDQGWLEYFLPDSTVYFVHPTLRVITEVDLYSGKRFDLVNSYLERHVINPVPQGMELWLREIVPLPGSPPPKKGSGLASLWVNHVKKNITFTPPFDVPMNRHIRPAPPPEDQVDMEYRYWLFMESHPAHCSLPHGARTDALDVLSWAWSDRLLPNHRSLPAPFSQEECQELLGLLRSFPDQGEPIQAVVQNRVIARVLLRVAHWRQAHFRSNKPLPDDVGSGPIQPPKRPRSIGRVFIDFILSCVFLGIPYIFFQRNHYHRIDEESGFRQGAPLFVIGACTCLVAAIVLSASVTFLSLPGVDGIAKIAGVMAILCASFSMATTVLAVFKFKANMERPTSYLNGEGFLALSSRSVVFSLPLVFLAYSIIAFITAIVLYSMQGATIKDPIHGDYQFDDLSRWTIMGLIGGLAGIITSSFVLLRR